MLRVLFVPPPYHLCAPARSLAPSLPPLQSYSASAGTSDPSDAYGFADAVTWAV